MAITKSGGKYFTDVERVWEEAYQLGLKPFRIGEWKGAYPLPEHPTPADLKPHFAGAELPRVQKNRVGCYDITFTASKSVSILMFALTPPSEWKANAAVIAKAAAAQVEPLLAKLTVNAGAQGATKLPAQGAGVVLTHFLSKPGDPHGHCHVATANQARTADGKVGSIANAKMLYDEQGASRAGFQKDLDDYLQREGFKTTRVGKAVDVVGIPAALIAELSQARAAMDEARRQNGFSGPRAADFFARQARLVVPPGQPKSAAEHYAQWSAVAKKHGVSLASLRTGEALPLIGDRRVRKYVAFCTARDALATCTKRYGTFTPAQYREAVYLLGIGRPTTRAALDREADRVLSRPKYARVHRSGPDAGEERYSTRGGEKKRAAAEQEYVAEAFGELRAAAGKFGKAVLVKTANAATKVMETIAGWLDPVPVVVRLDGRDGDRFLKAHTLTGYLVAHGKALLSGLLVRGNPHERAGVAENTFKRLRSHAYLPRGAVLVVDSPDALSIRQLRRLADVAKRDGASVVLAGTAANEQAHGRTRRDRGDVGRDRRD